MNGLHGKEFSSQTRDEMTVFSGEGHMSGGKKRDEMTEIIGGNRVPYKGRDDWDRWGLTQGSDKGQDDQD